MAFGESGVIGVRAKTNIPRAKVSIIQAFLFIPHRLIICPTRARESAIGFIFSSHEVFKTGKQANDYILWTYLMYERLKREDSFFYHYFQVCHSSDPLMDWTAEELTGLQDQFLTIEAQKSQSHCTAHYECLLPVLQKHPEHFPESDYKALFKWAYKLVISRAFCTREGDIIPLADALNHSDVYVDYMHLSHNFLTEKSQQVLPNKDYQDFTGESCVWAAPIHLRSHLNKLEKYISLYGDLDFQLAENIWELEGVLSGLESSSDEEENMNGIPIEEDSEEESPVEELEGEDTFEGTEKFFVMRTGDRGGFLAGSEVFNCYGRLNNFDLMLEYGFSLLPNRYDSVYLRVTHIQLFNMKQNKEKTMEFHYLKYNKLCQTLLNYMRNRAGTQEKWQNNCLAEKAVVQETSELLKQVVSQYSTTLQHDEELLNIENAPKQLFALSNHYSEYRVSQKRILAKQLEMLNDLEQVLDLVSSRTPFATAHWHKTIESARIAYPLRTYLKRFSQSLSAPNFT